MFGEKIKSGVVWVYSGSISMTPAKTQFLQYEPCVLGCCLVVFVFRKKIFCLSTTLHKNAGLDVLFGYIYFFLVNYFRGIF